MKQVKRAGIGARSAPQKKGASMMDKKAPLSLRQEKTVEGYLSSKRMFMLAGSIVTIGGMFIFLPQAYSGGKLFLLGVGILAGVLVSDRTLWMLGKATENNEILEEDLKAVLLLKFTCYADIFLGMIEPALPFAVQKIYFGYLMPGFLGAILMQWELLMMFGARAKLMRIKHQNDADKYMNEVHRDRDRREEDNARLEERLILSRGNRRKRLAAAAGLLKMDLKEITGRRGKRGLKKVAQKRTDLIIDKIGAAVKRERAEFEQRQLNPSGDGYTKEISLENFTLSYGQETKGKCSGCSEDLPINNPLTGKPWVSQYCPDKDGKPKEACRKAKSRKKQKQLASN